MSQQIIKWCDAICHNEDEMHLGSYRTFKMIKDESIQLSQQIQHLEQENAALREEVEKYKCLDGFKQLQEEARKQTAQEILDSLTQEEIRRITSVGDPRITTISSKLLAMMAELRQRYGLEG